MADLELSNIGLGDNDILFTSLFLNMTSPAKSYKFNGVGRMANGSFESHAFKAFSSLSL